MAELTDNDPVLKVTAYFEDGWGADDAGADLFETLSSDFDSKMELLYEGVSLSFDGWELFLRVAEKSDDVCRRLLSYLTDTYGVAASAEYI